MSTDDPGLVYLAYMAFKDVGLSESYGSEVITSGDSQQLSGPLMQHLRNLGCRRRAEAGHLLVSLLSERKLFDCVVQYDAHRPESKVSLRKLVTELHGKVGSSASLETSALMIAEVGTEVTSVDWDDLIDVDLSKLMIDRILKQTSDIIFALQHAPCPALLTATLLLGCWRT